MSACNVHKNFFDDNCPDCKLEYAELKGLTQSNSQDKEKTKIIAHESTKKEYKEFSEERAKKALRGVIGTIYENKINQRSRSCSKSKANYKKAMRY